MIPLIKSSLATLSTLKQGYGIFLQRNGLLGQKYNAESAIFDTETKLINLQVRAAAWEINSFIITNALFV